MLWPLLTEYRSHTHDPFRLLADKAYGHSSTRERLRKMKIPHTVPERSDQIARRNAKGSAGGRPPAFDPEIYRDRDTVGRGFSRLKQWPGIPTRHDKHALTHLGGIVLAAITVYHRVHNQQTRQTTAIAGRVTGQSSGPRSTSTRGSRTIRTPRIGSPRRDDDGTYDVGVLGWTFTLA